MPAANRTDERLPEPYVGEQAAVFLYNIQRGEGEGIHVAIVTLPRISSNQNGPARERGRFVFHVLATGRLPGCLLGWAYR